MRVVAALVAPAALALAAFVVASSLTGTDPPAHAAAGKVLWGGFLFDDRASMRRYLAQRGISYERWERRHAGPARRAFEPPPRVAPAPQPPRASDTTPDLPYAAIARYAAIGALLAALLAGLGLSARRAHAGERLAGEARALSSALPTLARRTTDRMTSAAQGVDVSPDFTIYAATALLAVSAGVLIPLLLG